MVANARKVQLIAESRKKDDRLDAQTLARLARIDPQLLYPVKHRSVQAQADLTVIRARAGRVRARTALVNTARGLAKSYGERLRSCNVRNLNPEKAESLSPELQAAREPLLKAIASLSEHIVESNERIESLAQQSYPQVALLKQIKGVGTLIGLTFLLTLEDPHRFRKSRDVGCYLRDEETRVRANRRCTSAKKAIRICGRCWCKERSTFWVRSVLTVISGAGA
jgi:transposase